MWAKMRLRIYVRFGVMCICVLMGLCKSVFLCVCVYLCHAVAGTRGAHEKNFWEAVAGLVLLKMSECTFKKAGVFVAHLRNAWSVPKKREE